MLCFLILGAKTTIAQSNWKPDNSKGFLAHDPVMIKEGTYFLFTTGGGMAKSKELENWKRLEPVPSKLEWVTEDIIPGYQGG